MRPYRCLPAVLLAFAAVAQDGEDLDVIAVEAAEVEEQPADAEAPDEGTQLDEIIVTAQRRAESLQATPISIEAFNREALQTRGIEGVHDLRLQVPSLTIEPFPTHNATLRIFIRGIGINDAQLTQDPAVGVYVDGVYIARSVGLALDIADLDRIEVLRGPQGTLYGRNTTGGAINLITKRPNLGVFSMAHQFTLGSRGQTLGKLSFNLPLGETAALKVAALGSMRDGFVENTGPGGDFGDREETAFRVDGRWVPAWWLTADYAYERTDMEYYNYMFQSVLRPRTHKGQAEVFKPYAESQTLYSSERLEALASGPPLELSGTTIDGHALTLTAPFHGDYELKYIGSFRELSDAEYADLGGGAGSLDYRLDSHAYDGPAADEANGGPTPLVIPTVRQEQWSHELQLTGRLLDDQLRFIVGAFYFNETATEDRHRLNHQVSTFISPDQIDEVSVSFPELDSVLGPLGILGIGEIETLRLVNFVDFNWDIENTAKAYFGEVTFTPEWLDRRLHLTAGYRHSDDRRDAVKFRISDTYAEASANGQGVARLLSSGEFFDNVPASRSFSDDSVSFVAAFDATPSLHVFLKSIEAYKSGGYNVRDPHISGASEGNSYGFGFVEGFEPEKVRSLEAGIKSEWLGRRLRVNASVFDSDYTDMQINFLIPGTISDTKVRNAGKARMRGLELDVTAAVARGLTLLADYAWLDADVLDVRDFDGNNVAHLFPFVSAPPHSAVGAIDWTVLERGWGSVRAFVAYNYIAERQGLVIAEERRGLTAIPAYGLWSLRLGVNAIPAGRWGFLDVALWGRNLADEVYPLIAIDNVPHADRAVVWGEPRAIGMDLTYRFN